MRSAVIILEQDRLALIKRVRNGQTYYLFPGGTIEAGETPEAAAIREAYEELGVRVGLSSLAAIVTFQQKRQFYYHAIISDGQFGSGIGEEFASNPTFTRGSYQAVWLGRQDWAHADIRPQKLLDALLAVTSKQGTEPLYLDEE